MAQLDDRIGPVTQCSILNSNNADMSVLSILRQLVSGGFDTATKNEFNMPSLARRSCEQNP